MPDETFVPDEGDDAPMKLSGTRELTDAGFRPIILHYIANGFTGPRICEILKERYMVEVHPNAIQGFRQAMSGDASDIEAMGLLQEKLDLHKEAMQEFRMIQAKWHQAMESGDVDKMRFWEQAMGRWWDRAGEMAGGLEDVPNTLINVDNRGHDITEIVLDELEDDPEHLESVAERLEENDS